MADGEVMGQCSQHEETTRVISTLMESFSGVKAELAVGNTYFERLFAEDLPEMKVDIKEIKIMGEKRLNALESGAAAREVRVKTLEDNLKLLDSRIWWALTTSVTALAILILQGGILLVQYLLKH